MLSIQENVRSVLGRIASAAGRAGRNPDSVALMAAVKVRSPEEITAAVEAGVTHLGENRLQEGLDHLAHLPPKLPRNCTLHFIGTLQSNKARKVLKAFHSVDSVSSLSLAERLSRIAVEEGLTREAMVEINLGEENAKTGAPPEDTALLAGKVNALPGLRLTGLMGMPPYFEDPEKVRPCFKRMRRLWEDVRVRLENPEGFRWLSMGMSHDFEVAVEEGATLVRVGTALFGPRRTS
ncbi:MAG: YggS family pyridoxal phosphate-dependent enzyme [Acidobacteriota bacterium]